MTRTEKIDALRKVPAQLRDALHDVTEADLGSTYRPGGWSVRQIVHHIAESHMHAYLRMMWILSEDEPTLKTYDQDEWARARQYSLDIGPSLGIIEGLQSRMADFFENLTEAEWSRSALHPERGRITLSDMLDLYFDHGGDHIAQIRKAREQPKPAV